jgi:hypothetical protein
MLLGAQAVSAQATDGAIGADEYPNRLSRGDGSYLLAWGIEGRLIHLAMSARTEGWVGLAIDPIVLLDNGDFLYGWIDAEGRVQTRDAQALGPRGPIVQDTARGGTDDILAAAGTRGGGRTTIEIVRLLDTGDRHDAPIRPQGGDRIVWAYGPDPADPSRMRQYGEAYLRPGEELRPGNWWASVTTTPLYAVGLTLVFLFQASAMVFLRLGRARVAAASDSGTGDRARPGDGPRLRYQIPGWIAVGLAGALAQTVLVAPRGPLTLSALAAILGAGTGVVSLIAGVLELRAPGPRRAGARGAHKAFGDLEPGRARAILEWVTLLWIGVALGLALAREGVF